MNKEADNDWFTIESNKTGTRCVRGLMMMRRQPACVCMCALSCLLTPWRSVRAYHNSWTGKCWSFHNGLRYEFDLEFEVRYSF